MLLGNGADPDQIDVWGATPLGVVNAVARNYIERAEDVRLFLDLYRLFIRDFDELFEDLDRRWPATSGFQGPAEALSLIQGYSFKNYSDLPLEIRFKRAMALDNWWVRGPCPITLRIAMGGDRFDPSAYLLEDDNGETLLFRIVQCMAVEFSARKNSNIQQWRQLLCDAIAASADLCHVSSSYGGKNTPLIEFLHYFTKDWAEIKRAGYNFDPIIQLWASELQFAGVDLANYGAKEKALYTFGVVNPDVYIYVGLEKSGPGHDPETGEFLRFHFLSLEYGPRPEDWKLWASNPVDEMVWEFWEMIERGEQVMPGTWID
ncbi:hypothetical protein N7474_000817 [Penicillium riverlandense]|uniref:uncharacterized protein n=1 Tax=Penicillium riverlandense TaxID=1903569 RepID=UPI0025497C0B|nr:uncharacterized protein N7474_000817 [Penicillium riverlandense]KAJ5832506.1 hypothetical protein N7474_000817 [Penicillium riverlandense]